jgi:hypothetical protein
LSPNLLAPLAVARLPMDALVEIDVIAMRRPVTSA